MPADWFTGGADGGPAIGLWLGLANAYSAELCATLGFDWLLIDAEHAPNTVRTVLHQLQAISGTASTAVVRPPTTDADTIKRYLDIGARHLLLPMIDNAEQARDAVAASRYPPHGIRGVGSALARASEWGGQTDYLATANTGLCLIAQIETPAAVAAVDDIARTDGIDAIFVGLSDLAATMGHLGRPAHPDVQSAFAHVVARARHAGKPVGTLATSPTLAQSAERYGCSFIAVGTDVGLLVGGGRQLLARARGAVDRTPAASGY
ncbi:HpcH/HpaI aldolase family protein [Mycolicibacterium llatzerense]|uniref:HpcH/HpaI aldolase family protein n=1 Tax=Mycolicibacterium llatzerense TaxID=280871 RepID=UPI0008DE8C2B|nr:HpcH/HpaI aldolase/citrate lyase family protein [Mycolicibacterium llatzerense]